MFKQKKKEVKKKVIKIKPKLYNFTCGKCFRVVTNAPNLNCPYCKND